jgi:hypothetical protein
MASKDPKTFDVAHPGKSAAPATSKPVIVTNRPMVQDPTLVKDKTAETADEPEDSKPAETPVASRVKIEPLSDNVKPESDDKAAPADDKQDEQAVQDSIDDGDDEPKAKAPNADDQDLAAKRAAERAAQLNKIAEAHTYYLPINQVVRRRSRHVAVAGFVLILCLGVAWADIALDAGLISIPGVKAPTHFFDNK